MMMLSSLVNYYSTHASSLLTKTSRVKLLAIMVYVLDVKELVRYVRTGYFISYLHLLIILAQKYKI